MSQGKTNCKFILLNLNVMVNVILMVNGKCNLKIVVLVPASQIHP